MRVRAAIQVVLLLGVLASCDTAPRGDCSSEQGWSAGALAGLVSEQPPFEPIEPQGFGVRTQAGVPVVRSAEGVLLPSIVASDAGLVFPVSVESVALDGGAAPFQFHVYLDGEPWPLTFTQNGDVVARPDAGSTGLAAFEVGLPAPAEPGAHDLLLITIREKPILGIGASLTWLHGGTQLGGANGPAAAATPKPRTGLGSELRGSDGSIILFPVQLVPEAGVFAWTAHLEDDSAESARSCEGTLRRYRLLAFLDGAPWPIPGGQHHLDVDVPVGAAADVGFRLEGLPTDSGHAVSVLLQQNAGRFQVRPDGSVGPWFNMLVAELGSSWW